jgi:MFS family permease
MHGFRSDSLAGKVRRKRWPHHAQTGDAAMSQESRIGSWIVVFILRGTMTFSFVDRFALSLMVDPIRQYFGLSDREIGLINGIGFGLFYSVMCLPFGFLADRWSRKGTIILGVTVWSLATATCGLASSVMAFAAGRAFVGAGEAGLAPAAYSMISDRFSKRALARAIGVFQFGSVIGSGLALVIGGAAYRYFSTGGGDFWPFAGLEPWQKTFLALASPGIPCLLLLAFLRDTGGRASAPVQAGLRHDYAEVRQNAWRYALMILGVGFLGMCSSAFLTWIPTVIAREYGWLPSRTGAEYGLMLVLVSPLGIFLGGWLSDVLVDRGHDNAHALVVLLSAVVTLALSFGVAQANSPSALLYLVGTIHFAICFVSGTAPAYLQITTPKHARGQVSAIYILVQNAMGLGFGPPLIGWLSSAAGHDPQALRGAVIAVIIPSLVVAAMLFAALAWQDRRSGLVAAAEEA